MRGRVAAPARARSVSSFDRRSLRVVGSGGRYSHSVALPDPAGSRDDPAILDERQVSIVLVGSFNPRILQPSWFDARGLLDEEDVESVNMIVSEAITAFRAPLFTVVCDHNRCQFTTTSKTPTPDIVKDLAVDTFKILAETPINRIGINALAHLPANQKSWDALTAQLGDPQAVFVLMDEQKLRTIELTGRRPNDDVDGSCQILMQPSGIFPGGVYVQINDDLQVSHPDEGADARQAMDILQAQWKASRDFAEITIERVAPSR